jgi:hypothetical protein
MPGNVFGFVIIEFSGTTLAAAEMNFFAHQSPHHNLVDEITPPERQTPFARLSLH